MAFQHVGNLAVLKNSHRWRRRKVSLEIATRAFGCGNIAAAKTVTTLSGFTGCASAMPIAGRASPAAHPQTEFTTIITVPFVLRITSSKSSGVRVSSTPKRVRSSLMSLIRVSGYGITGVYHTGISYIAGPELVQN